MDKMNSMGKTSFFGLDICRWILSILVVSIHTQPLVNLTSNTIQRMNHSVTAIAVPTFFVISSYLLFHKMKGSYRSTENLARIKKYILKILKLYCVWTLIYLPLTMYYYLTNGNNFIQNTLDFMKGILFVGEHHFSWPLWYLLSTIYALSFVYLALRIGLSEKMVFVLSFAIFSLSGFMPSLVDTIGEFSGITNTFIGLFAQVFYKGRIFTGFGYIALGMMIAKTRIALPRTLSILCIIGIFIFRTFVDGIGWPVSDLCLLALSGFTLQLFLTVRGANPSLAYKMRKSSTGIYFSHMIFYSLYSLIFYNSFPNAGLDFFLVAFLGAQLLSAVVLSIGDKKRFQWVQKIF